MRHSWQEVSITPKDINKSLLPASLSGGLWLEYLEQPVLKGGSIALHCIGRTTNALVVLPINRLVMLNR